MTTPTGQISLSDIQTEFGGSNPIYLTEYYSGGLYVPKGNNGSIPSSGQISMNDLRGKTITTNYVTVGHQDVTNKFGGYLYTQYGWATSVFGSINTVTNNFYIGATLNSNSLYQCYWYPNNLTLWMTPNNRNSTLYSVNVGGTVFNSSATASRGTSGSYTYFNWTTSTNPFGTTDGIRVKLRFYYTSTGDTYSVG